MNRTRWLAAVAVILAPSPCLAQFGAMGGMGGGAAPGATRRIMQGGRLAGAGFTEVLRSARVEMEGGQLLTGKIDLRPVVVDGDLGQYAITPGKIKMIRFLKPVNAAEKDRNGEAGGGEQEVAFRQGLQNQAAMLRAGRGGGGGLAFLADASSRTGAAVLTRGKVITTTDQEIIGTIHIPSDFSLELEFGSLTLAPVKLRAITFSDDDRQENPAKAGAAALSTSTDAGPPASGEEPSPPRYFRQGSSIIVISPKGDRVTLYNFDTKKSESLELSGSKDGPLEVTPILAENLAALMLKGPKVTRIAVADTASGTWHAQMLRKPIDGQAVPIVESGVVVYKLGRDVYAYGVEAQRWDVVELPEGSLAAPSVGAGTITIESDGHIYTFTGKTGKWDHVDVRTILGGTGAEKK